MALMFWLKIVILVALLGKCFTMFVFPRILSRWLALNHKMTSEDGYVASPDLSRFLGREGVALTDACPSGKAEIDGQSLDISVRQGYLKKGTRIRVIETCAGNIYVEPASEPGDR